MRLIYVAPFLRVPADFGIAIRNYHILQHLTARHTVHVVTWGDDETGQTDRWLIGHGATILRLPFAFPWANQQSHLARLRQMSHYPPLSFQRFAPAALANCLQDLIRQQPDIDLTLLDTELAGQVLVHTRLNRHCVLVLHDVYEVLLRRNLAIIGLRPSAIFYAAEWLKTAFYESRVLSRQRHIVTVSPSDGARLAKRFSKAEIIAFPNGVDTGFFTPVRAERNGDVLLFVGGFEYGPNVDAALYFCREILPIVRAKRPGVRFVAAGRNPPASMKAIAEKDATVTVTGTVPDIRPYYSQASVVVVPLRVGSGMKLKILEAFAMGVPVVSTSVGLEGIQARDGEHVALAGTPQAFAEKILWLFDHPAEAHAMVQRARKLVEEKHDWNAIANQFEQYLLRVSNCGAG